MSDFFAHFDAWAPLVIVSLIMLVMFLLRDA